MRQPLYAEHGVVATSQPLAAAAGLAVLRRGGNAVDAALATAITLTAVQPTANGIGGDLFAIVWDGAAAYGLNASGRSPAALTRAVVPGTGMPERGWLPVTVPGAPAGWHDLHERFGSVPFEELFADAIGYCEGGFPVSPMVARGWDTVVREVQPALAGPEFAEWPRVFAPGGRAPRTGERWRNRDAGRALRLIARSRADALYHGELASAIDDFAARTGGLLTGEDLAAHGSTWVEPIGTTYRGYDVWELPPNGQGLAALLALNILESYDLAGAPQERRLHWMIEAMKLGFADVHAYVADPQFTLAPLEGVLDRAYAAGRRELIGEQAGTPAAGDPVRGGTVYLCTADAAGMMVSLIQSTYMGFGSHVVVPGTGFSLQNRGVGFSLDRDHPNVVAPRKRPFHTIIPGFLTRAGRPVGPFGVMGGHMQPQGHVQVVVSTVDDGLDPQRALDRPRWYWRRGTDVEVEPGLPSAAGLGVVPALRRRGHRVSIVDYDPARFGYGQAIWRLPGGAGYVAGSDPRADGCAIGY